MLVRGGEGLPVLVKGGKGLPVLVRGGGAACGEGLPVLVRGGKGLPVLVRGGGGGGVGEMGRGKGWGRGDWEEEEVGGRRGEAWPGKSWLGLPS